MGVMEYLFISNVILEKNLFRPIATFVGTILRWRSIALVPKKRGRPRSPRNVARMGMAWHG